ncbi:MAG: MBOAT family protein [Bacteroidales bacterium]|nr:MBOAT family protein [Bacteroidales bacterium]
MEFLNNLADLFIFNPDEPLIFSSGHFLLLFIVFLTVYNLIYKHKTAVSLYIVAFSLFFYYKSSGLYLWILVLTTVLSYLFGKFLSEAKTEGKKKLWLVAGVVPPLLMLAYFKYTNFLIFNFSQIVGENFAFQEIFLPVGISFYTFQSLSYIIDVYRKNVEPADSLLDFAFYLTFFPQLVAGPIVKANLFLPQLKKTPEVTLPEAYTGLWMIILGLFKKAVIADYIAQYNDLIFAAPQNYNGFENLMAVYGYALQIFCDFSGYSDMAIGIGKIMGYDLGVNFLSPYKSLSVSEFWKRWHISLSSWLQEYLYIPLGGNREVSAFSVYAVPVMLILISALTCSLPYTLTITIIAVSGLAAYKTKKNVLVIITLVAATIFAVAAFSESVFCSLTVAVCIVVWIISIAKPDSSKMIKTDVNLLLTMLIGGLWHGAAWKFVFWGGAHGVALGIDKLFKKILPQDNKVVTFFSWLLTFNFVVFLWMFFRANDIENEGVIISAFEVPFVMLNQIFDNFDITFFSHFWAARALWIVLTVFGFVCHAIPEKTAARIQEVFVKSNIFIKIIVLLVVIQLVVQFQSETVQPFIYFQF